MKDRFQNKIEKYESQQKMMRLLDNCLVCNYPVYIGQTAVCLDCGKRVHHYFCDCGFYSNLCCKFCLKKLWTCGKCNKKNLLFQSKCQQCYTDSHNKFTNFCKKCRKPTDSEICENCFVLDNICCVNCNKNIILPVCFICNVCDKELDGNYCRFCDYVVDYLRLPCGKCRKVVKRCIVCEIGVIKDDDKQCSICKSTIEFFKWLPTT